MEQSWWHTFITAPRAERAGLIGLGVIAVALLAYRISLDNRPVSPPVLTASQVQLQSAFRSFLERQGTSAYAGFDSRAALPGELFPFDPNTLDSAGFIKLGLRPFTVQKLLNWRRKGKVFYDKVSFSKVWTLRPEEFERLKPYIVIQVEKPSYPSFSGKGSFVREPLPAIIDLNTTDSAMLVRLNGIGPTLAHRIMERRRLLGGFLRHEQLLEVYRFPDTTYAILQQKLQIRPEAIKKWSLNQVTEDELAAHPYVGAKMAKNIILYRTGLKRFDNLQQLRQVPLMNEENYRRIAPYFSIP